jgi:hypothetical protein
LDVQRGQEVVKRSDERLGADVSRESAPKQALLKATAKAKVKAKAKPRAKPKTDQQASEKQMSDKEFEAVNAAAPLDATCRVDDGAHVTPFLLADSVGEAALQMATDLSGAELNGSTQGVEHSHPSCDVSEHEDASRLSVRSNASGDADKVLELDEHPVPDSQFHVGLSIGNVAAPCEDYYGSNAAVPEIDQKAAVHTAPACEVNLWPIFSLFSFSCRPQKLAMDDDAAAEPHLLY